MNGAMSFSSMYGSFILVVMVIHLVQNSESLSIKLVHPFSSDSPFYKPNITHYEVIKWLSLRSRTREESPKITSSNNTMRKLKAIRPVMEHTPGGYLAKLNLGTFLGQQPSYKSYYLNFDTGSDLTWLQCEKCRSERDGHCFHQNGSPYPNSKSKTFAPLPCGEHRLCYPNECRGPDCSYFIHYDTEHSFGILAHETFVFDSSDTVSIVIGCGIHNKMELLDDYKNEAGILGMGWGPHSFVNQIATHSQGRFSYCLPPLIFDGYGDHPAILRFGHDIPALHGLHSLPMQYYAHETTYYVDLQGISINARRLNIPSEYFAKRSPTHGGCIFDTGTRFSLIPQRAYRILKEEMLHYLASADSSLRLRAGWLGLDLCFWRHQPFKKYNHLPTVTFHFNGGADLVLQRDIAFVVHPDVKKEYVCLAIQPSLGDDIAVIGAQPQANHLFVFDLPAKRMFFGPRDCARNP